MLVEARRPPATTSRPRGHFFQNITSLHLGYLTVPPGAEAGEGRQDFVDWAWLESQPAHACTELVRHLRFPSPLRVELDGARGWGMIAKPGA